jgi:hypothetical protein
MFMLFLICLVVVTQAACPNLCNGNGWCDSFDICHCYVASGTQTGSRPLYHGADCSIKSGAFGISYNYISDSTQGFLPVTYDPSNTLNYVGFLPSNSISSKSKLVAYLNNGYLLASNVGIDVRVVSVDYTGKTLRFQYKTNTQSAFSAEIIASLYPNAYTSKVSAYHVRPDVGNGPTDSGIYMYFSLVDNDFLTQTVNVGDWYFFNVTYNEGVNFDVNNHNTAHSVIECSGQGVVIGGSCQCFDGFSGNACQRSTCPNDCSGHGICSSINTFVEESTIGILSYGGYDGDQQYSCQCDAGYRGSDCSLIECPSGPDPLGGNGGSQGRDCSGRGTCDYSTGLCKCFPGFIGGKCESITTQAVK